MRSYYDSAKEILRIGGGKSVYMTPEELADYLSKRKEESLSPNFRRRDPTVRESKNREVARLAPHDCLDFWCNLYIDECYNIKQIVQRDPYLVSIIGEAIQKLEIVGIDQIPEIAIAAADAVEKYLRENRE